MAKNDQHKRRRQSRGGQYNNEKQVKTSEKQTSSIYTRNNRLVEDAGRLAFAQSLGTTYSLGNYSIINTNNRISGLTGNYITGAMRIGLRPSYGGTLTPTSPLNMATRNIYSFVRHANSGHANYEAADLMLYLLQMNEVLKLYSWFVRLYGISRTYNDKNRYYPKRIIESMGVDFEDLISNLANLRFQINVFANKLNSLNIPMNMPLFTESINLYSNLYLDGTDIKAQTYFFDLDSYYKFDATSSSTGGMLAETEWIYPNLESKKKVSELTQQLNSVLFNVLQNEDMNIMSGDILKAYGAENMLTLPQIPEDLVIYPIYDEVVLTQIENLSVTNRTDADITQSDQLLVSTPSFQSTSPTNSLGKVLTFKWDDPTPSQVIDATRLAIITPITSTQQAGSLRLFKSEGLEPDIRTGTHIVGSLQVIVGISGILSVDRDILIDEATFTMMPTSTYSVIPATHFNYYPLRMAYRVDSNSGTYTFANVVGDIQNYTILSKEDLDKIHETAMLSLFDI